MELKPKNTKTKTVVYRTETYTLVAGVNLVVEYTDGVITEQRISVSLPAVKKWVSPFARGMPKNYFLATPHYMTTIQIVPWYDCYLSDSENYQVKDILGDIRENGICMDRVIAVVDSDEMYAWGNPIPVHRVYGGDSTRHSIGSKRNYGPIKWDYEGIRDYLKTLPYVAPFEEVDQNRYDETYKVKMGIDRLMIKYTDKQMLEVVQGIIKFVADNKLKLRGHQMHDLLVNHLNLREPIPGVDTLGVEQFIIKRAYASWEPFVPKPEKKKK